MKTAILVDGGFYRGIAQAKLGAKSKPDLNEHIDGLHTCDNAYRD